MTGEVSLPQLEELSIAVVGLGYVGLPLAVELGRRFPTLGFDIDPQRVSELRAGYDRTYEVDAEGLVAASELRYTDDPAALDGHTVFIVTVPTPIDEHKRPDLRPLCNASATVGRALRGGEIVIYESTVYPGATEELCVPVLEGESGLRFNRDFYCGYSPERINPGDTEHRLTDIQKVTSGSTPQVAALVDELYRRIVRAGTFPVSSIRIAEAAKVIENTQRDVNIALINELAQLFNRLDIDTAEVLKAAATKWNFVPFKPGLVGGHCIGVDPYYLTYKAQHIGHHPEMILAGRRLNDSMGAYVADQVIRLMTRHRIHIVDARVLVMGLTFKPNCPDLRNTRVVDIVHELRGYQCEVDIYDPWVDPSAAAHEHGLELIERPQPGSYDSIVVAVGHRDFAELGAERIREYGKPQSVVYDVQHLLPRAAVDARL